MSAWIVSKNHIDHMVTELHDAGVAIEPNELGRILWRENLRSVAARYPHDTDGTRPGPIDFRDNDVEAYTWERTASLTLGGIAKTFGCWHYQSCETSDFEDSEAYRVVYTIFPWLHNNVSYDDSVPWGW